jgi:condensation enzyme
MSRQVGIEPRAPLSLNQEFLCAYDSGDDSGPFGPRYHDVRGWLVRGHLDAERLRHALRTLVIRHESLRTRVVRHPDGRYQEILSASTPSVVTDDISPVDPGLWDQTIEELLAGEETALLPGSEPPLIRVRLVRLAAAASVIIVTAHHSAVDGFSMRVIGRELARLLTTPPGEDAGLGDPRQYREFARWQHDFIAGDESKPRREYWSRILDGASLFTLPTDRPRSEARDNTTGVVRFHFDSRTTETALAIARSARATPFMFFFTAYLVFARQMQGSTDVTVPTFTSGRPAQFETTVGSFFNFMPLRVDDAGCRTFSDLMSVTRRVTLDGFRNDFPAIPALAPSMMAPAMSDDRATSVFQVFPFPELLDGERMGGLQFTEFRRRRTSQELTSDIPDGTLWTINVDTNLETFGSVAYRKGLYDTTSVQSFVDRYRAVVDTVTRDPNVELSVLHASPQL